jgi:glutamate formiminotransferase/formiminotetrahydrofolate cyclodeaminase
MLAKRVSSELGIPVYLYGKAALSPDRVRVSGIRKGGYEALIKNIESPEFKPDYGPCYLPLRHGATIMGAREFLIAYNINLDTTNVGIAKKIARVVRESGSPERDQYNRIVLDTHGKIARRPGLLKSVQADGWFMPTYHMAQVTMNLSSYQETGLHDAYETVRAEAIKHDVAVRGSEIIGLVPKAALLAAGAYYYHRISGKEKVNEALLIDTAIENLGLSVVSPFTPKQKIIENVLLSSDLL